MRTLPARARPYYYGWNVVAICVLAQLFALGVAFNCFALFVPIWANELAVKPSELLLCILIFTVMGIILNPVAGWASERFQARFVIGAGLSFAIAGYAAIALTRSAILTIAFYTLLLSPAVAFSSAVPTQAVVCRWFDRRRGLAMGLTSVGIVVAGVAFPPLVVKLLHFMTWRQLWLACAAFVAVVIMPLTLFGLYDQPAANDPFSYIDAKREETAASVISTWSILRRPNFWVAAIVYLFVMGAYLAVSLNLALIVQSHGFDLSTAGTVTAVFFASDFLGKLGFGVIVDRFGSRVSLVLLALLAALGCYLTGEARSLATLYIAVVPIGLTGGIWAVLPATMAAEFGSANFGRAFGFVSAGTPIASAVGIVLASMKEHSGSYTQGLLAIALLSLLGVVVALFLRTPSLRARPQLDAASS